MIGALRSVVVDCPSPRELGAFYEALIGGDLDKDDEEWVTLTTRGPRLAFQRSPEYRAPTFPDPHASQQFHLDVHVDDVDAAEAKVLAMGATVVPGAGSEADGDNFRVYRDPVGHTFCLVWGVPSL